MKRNNAFAFLVFAAMLFVGGCATTTVKPADCPAGTQKLENCPPAGAISDARVAELHAARSFDRDDLPAGFDPVHYARTVNIPVASAGAKFLGSDDDGALRAFAAKLWMIENAEYTLDVIYYIWRDDLLGRALLGAVCEAVQRGVDVRFMIDSVGSSNLKRNYLRALTSCAIDGGFMRNSQGQVTVHKARVQAGIFNATSKAFANWNRRSHDKLIVKDGRFFDKAYAVTGGRNISLDYYGFLEDGSFNNHSYRDADILVRGAPAGEQADIGEIVDAYYSLLFLFEDNKVLAMSSMSDPVAKYAKFRDAFGESLATLKALPVVQEYREDIDEFMSTGFHGTSVTIAHNLQNLTNKKVVSKAVENLSESPNSIISLLDHVWASGAQHVRIVSPYLFAAKYKDDDGNVVVDDARRLLEWLEENPESRITIVTNSPLTSDNFMTQSVIDLDLAPRLLLTPEAQELWGDKLAYETKPKYVQSDAWIEMVNHPRLFIYETGRMDDERFGGDHHYPKMHAKYVIGDTIGFVGTSNFDYRSRLYNNEMGFFFDNPELIEEIARNTDYLISLSYRWGSPEWLEMRNRMREWDGMKAWTVRHQRGIYKTMKNTGLMWLF